jgi:hypothetical protein
LNAKDTAENSIIEFNRVELYTKDAKNGEYKSTVKKLVAKAYPTISASTSSNDLILKITNPSDSDENITIRGF